MTGFLVTLSVWMPYVILDGKVFAADACAETAESATRLLPPEFAQPLTNFVILFSELGLTRMKRRVTIMKPAVCVAVTERCVASRAARRAGGRR